MSKWALVQSLVLTSWYAVLLQSMDYEESRKEKHVLFIKTKYIELRLCFLASRATPFNKVAYADLL